MVVLVTGIEDVRRSQLFGWDAEEDKFKEIARGETWKEIKKLSGGIQCEQHYSELPGVYQVWL